MKRSKWWMGLLLTALAFVTDAQAIAPQMRATETLGEVTWSYSIGEDGAIVTGVSPSSGDLVVPNTLGGLPVVEIGYTAFASCEELTSVAIPTSVKSIADRAFQYCSLLEEVSIPDNVTNIGALAFQYCESLPVLVLPRNLESIGASACYHCTGLKKLYVPLTWWETTKAAAAEAGQWCSVVYGEPDTETVFFDANGGSCETANYSYLHGEPYGWLPEASHPYYSFDGWWTATEGGESITADSVASVEGRRPLFAHWAPTTVQVVTFNANGGSCNTTNLTYRFDSQYSPLPEAQREQYAFEGWWTSPTGGVKITETTIVTADAARTLYAQWRLAEQVVVFLPNGGTCDTVTRTFEIGQTYKPLPMATREGYTFDGWFTADGNRLSEASIVTPTATQTLYAHWTLVEQLVTFNANGGKCSTSNHTYSVGGTYAWFPEASRAGWVFLGWRRSTGEEVLETSNVPGQRTQVLYAGWLQCTLAHGAATVTGLVPKATSGNIVVPATVDGFPVTSIASNTFSGCTNLTAVTIPDSVTSIGSNAFYRCSSALFDTHTLPGITLVDGWAIGATNLHASVLDLTGIRGIGAGVFSGFSNLTGVTIPYSVVGIGNRAFFGCSKLTNLTIPDSTVEIGDYAFYNCIELTNATLGNCVAKIGTGSFYGCAKLASMTIPDSVASIGSWGFAACSGMTNVEVGNGVTAIGSRAFYNCSNLTSVLIHDATAWCGISFADSGANPLFATTPSPRIYLDGEEIAGNFTIPDGVTNIGLGAFYYCTNLTSVTIPDGVTNIGAFAFSNCTRLVSVTLPGSVKSIGDSAFSGCCSLKAVYLHDLAAWCGISFNNFEANPLLASSNPSPCIYLDGKELSGDLVIPDHATNIGPFAFLYCTNLTSLTIGNGVLNVGYGAFQGCDSLRNVTIGTNVTNIEDYAFLDCSAITNIIISDCVRRIGEGAFYNCSNLTEGRISISVGEIGDYAFDKCPLKTLYAPVAWQSKYVNGIFWSLCARVRLDCDIVYYATETSSGIPYSWLDGYGLGNGTSEGYETAVTAKAANGTNTVAECYVAGLNPTNPDSIFMTTISITNGFPVVSWTPDLNKTKTVRSYVVEGKTSLTNDWGKTNAATRFFRVKVALP